MGAPRKYEAQQGGFRGDPVSGNQPKDTLYLSKVLGERKDHEQGSEEPPNSQIILKRHRQKHMRKLAHLRHQLQYTLPRGNN